MKILIEKQTDEIPEACCFCFGPTHFWNRENDVAVCPACATIHSQAEVPDKHAWLEGWRRLVAETRREARLPPLPDNNPGMNSMNKDDEALLNSLLPSGWRAIFVAAEDETVDDEFEIRAPGVSQCRFSLQRLSFGGGFSLNEFIRTGDGSIDKIISYPEIDASLHDAARRIARVIEKDMAGDTGDNETMQT